MLILKPYQRRTLDTLKRYLEAARLSGDPKVAYDEHMQATETPARPYLAIEGLETAPYVCVRRSLTLYHLSFKVNLPVFLVNTGFLWRIM